MKSLACTSIQSNITGVLIKGGNLRINTHVGGIPCEHKEGQIQASK